MAARSTEGLQAGLESCQQTPVDQETLILTQRTYRIEKAERGELLTAHEYVGHLLASLVDEDEQLGFRTMEKAEVEDGDRALFRDHTSERLIIFQLGVYAESNIVSRLSSRGTINIAMPPVRLVQNLLFTADQSPPDLVQ